MKKVLVTGSSGYIGVHLIDLLKQKRVWTAGCDIGFFKGCAFEEVPQADLELAVDFRALSQEDLKGYDAVMHLGAISNDPMGDLDPQMTYSINLEGTIYLAKRAKEAGIPLFLFASSCSIYGKGEVLDIDENGATYPLTPYAKSKIEAEIALQELSSKAFKTVCLRSATAYGYSPMLRIDLVVNNLLASAFATGDIRVMSDGSSWRPLIHCRDIARAFIAFLNNPPLLNHLVVNIGSNEENYQVKEVAERVQKRLPHTKVVYTGETGVDPRNYRVNFDRLKEHLPDFRLEYTLDKGIDELVQKFHEKQFSKEDFFGDRYIRLRTLKKQMERVYAIS